VAWSIEIDHDPSPMLIQWGYDPSNPSSISCPDLLVPLKLTMITPMLIQWGYDPSNPSSICMSTGAWSIEIDHDPSPMLIPRSLILQIHRQFHVNWCLVH
jgi:hypothetical protein